MDLQLQNVLSNDAILLQESDHFPLSCMAFYALKFSLQKNIAFFSRFYGGVASFSSLQEKKPVDRSFDQDVGEIGRIRHEFWMPKQQQQWYNSSSRYWMLVRRAGISIFLGFIYKGIEENNIYFEQKLSHTFFFQLVQNVPEKRGSNEIYTALFYVNATFQSVINFTFLSLRPRMSRKVQTTLSDLRNTRPT